MDFLDKSLLIGIFVGLLFWTLLQFIMEWYKDDELNSAERLEDYGGFLDIPFEQIVVAEENGLRKDLDSLKNKIYAFKRRNTFYSDKNFMFEKGLDEFSEDL